MRRSTLVWCVVLGGLALATPARAHVESASAAARLHPTAPVVPTHLGTEGVGLLLIALAAALVVVGRSRHALAVACLAVLLLVSFEAGLHSVHHLADHRDAQCVVASVSAHTGGLIVDSGGVALPTVWTALRAVPRVVVAAFRPTATDHGRAPPAA